MARDLEGRDLYRRVSVRVWDDDKFQALSRPRPNAQTLWIYLLTGRETTIIPGVVRSGPAGLAESLGWSVGALRACWDEVAAKGMAKADWPVRLIWLPNALLQTHNRPKSINQVKGWRRVFAELPASALRLEIARSISEVIAKTDEKLRAAWDRAGTELTDPSALPSALVSATASGTPTALATGTASAHPSLLSTGTGTGREKDHSPGGESSRLRVKLAHAVLDMGPESEADAADLLKEQMAKIGLPYTGRDVAKALDQAHVQRARRGAAHA